METRFKDAFRKIDLFIRQDIRASGVPAVVVGITNRERLLHVYAGGYADLERKIPIRPDSRFEIGSISKSFASIVLLQLQEQERLDIDNPVTDYLPWLKIKTRFKPITLRHLMSHTAGIILGSDESLSAYVEALDLEKIGASTPPGRYFHYSNTGYKILGLVLEELLGKSNGQIIKERVTEPLGMKDTETVIWNDTRERLPIGYGPYHDDRPLPRNGRLAPSPWLESDTADGSIVSTASDVAKYVRMILNKGMGPERRVVSQKSFEMLTRKIVDSSDAITKEHYGLGLGITTVNGHTCVGHTGGMSGFISEILADMDVGLGVVTLNNSRVDSNNIAVNTLTMLNAAVHGRRRPCLPVPRDSFNVKNASDYAGEYRRLDGKRVSFRSRRDRLYLIEGKKTIPLEQRDKDTFLADHLDYRLFLFKFTRKAGKVAEAFHGADWYPKDSYKGRRAFSHPRSWNSYPGHYRSHNPWGPNFRVVLRKGALVLIQYNGNEEPLVDLGEGKFRVGADKRCPERIEFSAIYKGKATVAVLSRGRYVRVSSP
jgi:CubicO group peptidase (beta-lactamase class C family)